MLIPLIFLIIVLTGCDTVDITERVIYTDGTPVKNAKVRQWTDDYDGATFTNEDGTWTLTAPEDVEIFLCIENPREQNIEACYYEGYLFTPTAASGSNEMIRISK